MDRAQSFLPSFKVRPTVARAAVDPFPSEDTSATGLSTLDALTRWAPFAITDQWAGDAGGALAGQAGPSIEDAMPPSTVSQPRGTPLASALLGGLTPINSAV